MKRKIKEMKGERADVKGEKKVERSGIPAMRDKKAKNSTVGVLIFYRRSPLQETPAGEK